MEAGIPLRLTHRDRGQPGWDTSPGITTLSGEPWIQTPAGDVEGLLDWAALSMVFGSQARVVCKGGGAPWPGGAQTCSPGPACRYRSLAQPAPAARLSSVSSHDSGFVSQEATYSKPPSPMPSDITSQVRGVC